MKNAVDKKKIRNAVIISVTVLFSVFLILCFITIGMYSATYLGRVLFHWDSDVTDYKLFPERIIHKSLQPYSYKKNTNISLAGTKVSYGNKHSHLRDFIKQTDTTAFIIVKNDEIVYEQYENGYNEFSVNTSFSMAKSVVSLLIGKAIENGFINSVNDPICDYIEEFRDKEIGKITIEELLLMRSEIVYEENKFLWFGDDSLTYWHDDLRKLALSHTELTDKYNGRFHYNNYHPLLLGIILERSTGESVSSFFEREIWQKIGAEYDASWSLCGNESSFEKMESGINFHAADFLKIGSMVLHNGYWNNTQIISEDWLKKSTLCDLPVVADDYAYSFLANKNIGYKYMWYCTQSPISGSDIIAWGKSDQVLYISAENNIVVLRTGKTDGGVSNWPDIIKSIIAQIVK